MSGDTPVILLVLRDAAGHISFLVDPDWQAFVPPEDREYIEFLMVDFVERAEMHPDELFRQLSSLGVGPLVTQKTGENISENAELLKLHSRFVRR